jgi:hypothetical protein
MYVAAKFGAQNNFSFPVRAKISSVVKTLLKNKHRDALIL